MEIDIRPHRDNPSTHSTVVVTTRTGRCYACTWAGTPTIDQAREAWRTDRRAFTAYNPVTGDH